MLKQYINLNYNNLRSKKVNKLARQYKLPAFSQACVNPVVSTIKRKFKFSMGSGVSFEQDENLRIGGN